MLNQKFWIQATLKALFPAFGQCNFKNTVNHKVWLSILTLRKLGVCSNMKIRWFISHFLTEEQQHSVASEISRATGARFSRMIVRDMNVCSSNPDMPWHLPLLDLCEEKLDLCESCDTLLELFLLTAVCCSGKWTWMDSTDAARLTDFKEAEESLLPPVRESSSSVSSLLLELSPFSSSSHNPWH